VTTFRLVVVDSDGYSYPVPDIKRLGLLAWLALSWLNWIMSDGSG